MGLPRSALFVLKIYLIENSDYENTIAENEMGIKFLLVYQSSKIMWIKLIQFDVKITSIQELIPQ